VDEIVVREYRPEDRDQCVSLLSRTFRGKSDDGTFRWRFETTGREAPLLVVALHREKVVSFISWIPWWFTHRGERLLGYQAGEAATDGEYRGRHLWSLALAKGHEIAESMAIDFLFGFPSRNSFNAFYRSGYTPIGTCCYHARLVNPFRRGAREPVPADHDYPFDAYLHQPEFISPLIDAGYLRWRYTDNPKTYEFVEYAEEHASALFIIRMKRRKKLMEASLMDCQFTVFDPKFVRNAFRHFLKALAGRASYIKANFNEAGDRGRALKQIFRIRFPSKSYVLGIKPLSEKVERDVLHNINYWDLMPHCVDEL